MKCKTTQDLRCDVNCHPPYITKNAMGRDVIAKGTIICRDEFALADCVSLVRNGLAIPMDDECRKACDMSQAKIDAAVAAMEKMLHPKEDEEDEFEEEDEWDG